MVTSVRRGKGVFRVKQRGEEEADRTDEKGNGEGR